MSPLYKVARTGKSIGIVIRLLVSRSLGGSLMGTGFLLDYKNILELDENDIFPKF
jgi:hypothetical protein